MNETNCIEAATWKLSGVIIIVIFFLSKKKIPLYITLHQPLWCFNSDTLSWSSFRQVSKRVLSSEVLQIYSLPQRILNVQSFEDRKARAILIRKM